MSGRGQGRDVQGYGGVEGMTSDELIRRLAIRHKEDVWVPECKDGPTHTRNHRRLDGWAMRKSWENPMIFGYEVKISRSDFMRDDKWQAYLPMCNQLSFVAPPGIIDKAELPEGIGLLEPVGTDRLITRRKAVYREIPFPDDVFKYILMCRAKVGPERSSEDRLAYWREWLAHRKDAKELGGLVSAAIAEHVRKVQSENDDWRRKSESIETALRTLRAMGIEPLTYEWSVKRQAEAIRSLIPDDFRQAIRLLRSSLDGIEGKLRTADLRAETEK